MLKVTRYIGSPANQRLLVRQTPLVTPYNVRGVGKAVLPKIDPRDVFRRLGRTPKVFGRALPLLERVPTPVRWHPAWRWINLALIAYEFYQWNSGGGGDPYPLPGPEGWDNPGNWDLPAGWSRWPLVGTNIPDTAGGVPFDTQNPFSYRRFEPTALPIFGQAAFFDDPPTLPRNVVGGLAPEPQWDGYGHAFSTLAPERAFQVVEEGAYYDTSYDPAEYLGQVQHRFDAYQRAPLAPPAEYVGPMVTPPGEQVVWVPPPWRAPDPNEQRDGEHPDLSEPVSEPEAEPPLSIAGSVEVAPTTGRAINRANERSFKRSGERDKKVLSRTAALGIAMFKAMDKISEASEIVDSIYDALPKDVKDRWEKDRGAFWYKKDGKWTKGGLNRGPADQFGQYGIDGADWKSQAIFYNWHKVDPAQAVRNIIKNEIEDQIMGRYHKHAPKNAGNAMGEQEKFLNKKLSDALEWLGL